MYRQSAGSSYIVLNESETASSSAGTQNQSAAASLPARSGLLRVLALGGIQQYQAVGLIDD